VTPRVAIATCREVPDLDEEGRLLLAALTDLGVSAEPAIWNSAAPWDSYSAVVLKATWDYFQPQLIGPFLSWTASLGHRLLNPPDVVAWNADKRYLRDFQASGLPIVPTAFLPPGGLDDLPTGQFVVKPTVSAGVNDTATYDDARVPAARRHIASLHAQDREVMIQPYLNSADTAEAETEVIFIDGQFSHSMRKGPLLALDWPLETDAWRAEDMMACVAAPDVIDLAEAAMRLITGRFGTPLYGRIDVLRDEAGRPALLEAELIEPSLFLQFDPANAAAGRLAHATVQRLAAFPALLAQAIQ
jgi:glutathione synthase/RimK-type ligase-like ATP-grasp enzyme